MARLPYDYDRLQGDDRGYDLRDWRSSPRVSTNRDLDKFVDEISCMAANMICEKATKSVFQTFHFNMMSRQDFMNEDFRGLIQFIVDVLEYQYATRNIRRYDDNLKQNVDSCVVMHCSKQIIEHRELLDIGYRLDGDRVCRAVQANSEKFLDIVHELERFQSEDQRDVRTSDRDDRDYRDRDRRDDRGGYSRDRDRDSRGGYRDSRDRRDDRNGRDNGYSRGGFGRDRDRYSRREEPIVSAREAQEHLQVNVDAPRYAEDMFVPLDRQGRPTEQRREQEEPQRREPTGYRRSSEFFNEDQAMDDRTSARAASYAPAPAAAPVFIPPAREMPRRFTEPTEPPPAPPAGSRQEDHLWDLHSPKTPAAAPAPDQHRYDAQPEVQEPKVVPSTVTTPLGDFNLVRFTNGETQMDATAHAAVYPVGGSASPVNMTEEVKRVLTLEEAVTAGSVTREQLEGSTEVMETLSIFDSVATLATHVSENATMRAIAESGENKDGVRRIYHSFGVVSNAIVGYQALNVLQGALRQATSLRDILTVLRKTMESTNERAPVTAAFATDMRSAVRRFDRVITREINVFCRDVLKISPGNVINSAIQSYNTLVTHLENDNSPGAAERNSAFLVFINNLTASIQEARDPKMAVERNVLEANDVDTSTHGAVMLPMSYLVTHLPFTMEEMGMERNGAVVVNEAEFSSFLKAALDVSKLEDELIKTPQRLLVTRDLEVFRVLSFPGKRGSLMLIPIDVL